MLKKSILVACILFTWLMLCSVDLDWGIKYGAGISSIHGKDLNYNLQYNFTSLINDTLSTDGGYLRVKSNHQKVGFSQAAGVFISLPLSRGENTLFFQPEINWQRYTYSYWFKGVEQITNDLTLTGEFPGSVGGFADATLDYINVPMLFKIQKDGSSEASENHAIIGMYGYIGPSVSFLIGNKTTYRGEIDELDKHVQRFVSDSQIDADTLQSYTYTKLSNSAEDIVPLKYDIVFGFGWNLSNALNLGFGKDEWVIDARFNLNVNKLGDFASHNNYKLYNAILSIGYKL